MEFDYSYVTNFVYCFVVCSYEEKHKRSDSDDSNIPVKVKKKWINDSNEFFVKEKWNQDDVKPFLGQISAQVYNTANASLRAKISQEDTFNQALWSV